MITPEDDTCNGTRGNYWTWGDSWATENDSVAFAGYNLGCSLLGNIIECTPNRIKFSCGYRIAESLPRKAKHYENNMRGDIDDGPIDAFEVTGVVLLALATQNWLYWTGDYTTVFVSDVLRIAKTADEIERPEEVFFEDVSLIVDNPACPKEFEECWGKVHTTFIVCWDNKKTGVRAYQFVRPNILSVDALAVDKKPPGCDAFRDNPRLVNGLGVYWPLIDKYTKQMEVAPKPENWTDWIDEILPRPKE